MKALLKSAAALLIVCAMVFAIPAGIVAVWANSLDLDQSCSIKVGVNEEQRREGYAELGLVADIYQLAGAVRVDGYDDYTFGLHGAYGALDLVNPGQEGVEWKDLAQAAAQIALDTRDQPVGAALVCGDPCDGLEPGLYLVLVRAEDDTDPDSYVGWVNDDENNEHIITKASVDGKEYYFSPILVSVPYREEQADNTNTASGSTWVYAAEITLKPEEHERERVKVKKVNEDGEALPGAEFKLYCSAGAPSSDFFLYQKTDGPEAPGYDKEIPMYLLGEYVTDENGYITLDTDYPAAIYALVETKAPEGYTCSGEPQFFYLPEADILTASEEEQIYFWNNVNVETGWIITYDVESRHRSVWVDEEFSDLTWHYTFTSPEDAQPYYIRAKVFFGDEVYSPFEGVQCTGALDDDWNSTWIYGGDDYWYYQDPLYGGGTTTSFKAKISVRDEEATAEWVMDDYRLSVLYEVIPVQYDDMSEIIPPISADWGLAEWNRSGESEGGALRAGYETFANAKGGHIIDLGDNYTYVEPKYYPVEMLEDYTLTVVNTPDSETDQPGTALPETGGIGTTVFYITGGLLAVTSLTLLQLKRKRSRRRRA